MRNPRLGAYEIGCLFGIAWLFIGGAAVLIVSDPDLLKVLMFAWAAISAAAVLLFSRRN